MATGSSSELEILPNKPASSTASASVSPSRPVGKRRKAVARPSSKTIVLDSTSEEEGEGTASKASATATTVFAPREEAGDGATANASTSTNSSRTLSLSQPSPKKEPSKIQEPKSMKTSPGPVVPTSTAAKGGAKRRPAIARPRASSEELDDFFTKPAARAPVRKPGGSSKAAAPLPPSSPSSSGSGGSSPSANNSDAEVYGTKKLKLPEWTKVTSGAMATALKNAGAGIGNRKRRRMGHVSDEEAAEKEAQEEVARVEREVGGSFFSKGDLDTSSDDDKDSDDDMDWGDMRGKGKGKAKFDRGRVERVKSRSPTPPEKMDQEALKLAMLKQFQASNLPKASSSKPHPDSSDSEDLRELIAASEAAAQGAPYVVPRKPVPRPKKKTPAPAPFMTESDEEEAEFNRARELALNEILGRDMALPGSAGNGVADEEEEDEEDEDGGMHLDDEGEKVTILVSMVFDPDLAQKVSKRAVDAFEKTITCEIGLNQPFLELRAHVAEIKNLAPDDVVLIYNNHRIYDFGTPASLKIFRMGNVEGYTEAVWEKVKKGGTRAKSAAPLVLGGGGPAEEPEQDYSYLAASAAGANGAREPSVMSDLGGGGADDAPVAAGSRFKIFVRGSATNSLPLAVKPATLLRQLLKQYCKNFGIGPERMARMWLEFDGDKLDLTRSLESYDEIEEEEAIDVREPK